MLSPEESEDPWLLEDTLTSSDILEGDVDPRNLVHFELFTLLQDMFTGKKSSLSIRPRTCGSKATRGKLERFFCLRGRGRRTLQGHIQSSCATAIRNSSRTLSGDTSASLFMMMFWAIQGRSSIRSTTDSAVDTLQDEVLALTFLEFACDDAVARYKLITSDPHAAPRDYERALVLHRAMRIWPLRNELRYTAPLRSQP